MVRRMTWAIPAENWWAEFESKEDKKILEYSKVICFVGMEYEAGQVEFWALFDDGSGDIGPVNMGGWPGFRKLVYSTKDLSEVKKYLDEGE